MQIQVRKFEVTWTLYSEKIQNFFFKITGENRFYMSKFVPHWKNVTFKYNIKYLGI